MKLMKVNSDLKKHDSHKCVTDDGITTESIDPKYRTIKQRERSARNDSKTQKSLMPGEIESDLSEQLAKAEPSIKRMPFGITIVFNSEEENADSSSRGKFDPGSNEIDEIEQQSEKHNLHKCVAGDETTNIENIHQFGPRKLGRTCRIACDRRSGQFG
jgi:hypothetical protein